MPATKYKCMAFGRSTGTGVRSASGTTGPGIKACLMPAFAAAISDREKRSLDVALHPVCRRRGVSPRTRHIPSAMRPLGIAEKAALTPPMLARASGPDCASLSRPETPMEGDLRGLKRQVCGCPAPCVEDRRLEAVGEFCTAYNGSFVMLRSPLVCRGCTAQTKYDPLDQSRGGSPLAVMDGRMRRGRTLPNERAKGFTSTQECLKMAADVVGNTTGNTDRWDQRQTRCQWRATQ
ncbi:hypothetical protein V8D89_008559 [Ganoderma adspersum]